MKNKVLAWCGAVLLLHLNACFRYQLTPEAQEQLLEINKLESTGNAAEICNVAIATAHSSAETLKLAGQCAEKGTTVEKSRRTKPEYFYRDAVICGSEAAQRDLARLGESVPEIKYAIGMTTVLLFDDSRPDYCGLEREVTTTGWIVSPIGVPLYFVGGAVAVVLVIPILVLATVVGGGRL